MTGGGRGLCVLKLPAEPNEPVIGFAGHAGWPVRASLNRQAELARLRSDALRIEAVLTGIRGQIKRLEAPRPQEPVGA